MNIFFFSEKKYKSNDELKDALLSRDVDGILIDAYTAGSERTLFDHPQIRASQILKYPRSYGIVMSGQLANVANEARDYISANQQMILDIIDKKTNKMEVNIFLETFLLFSTLYFSSG